MEQVIERKYRLLFGPDLTCLKTISLKASKIGESTNYKNTSAGNKYIRTHIIWRACLML